MKNGTALRLIVAVPVKDLTHAKRRLMSVLSPDERGELARAMLRDVLRALAGGRGPNGVALAPPDAMPLPFGEPSFARHLATARQRGLEPRVLSLPGLGLDVDAPEDLTALLAEQNTTETGRLVSTWRDRAALNS